MNSQRQVTYVFTDEKGVLSIKRLQDDTHYFLTNSNINWFSIKFIEFLLTLLHFVLALLVGL
jgi:hypothetical protein